MDRDPVASMQGLPPRSRTPWWSWLLCAHFLFSFGVGVYGSLMGFGSTGAGVSDAPRGGTLIDGVIPGSVAETAGLRAGDIVVAVNGQVTRAAHDWDEMTWQFGPVEPFVLAVARDNEPVQLTMRFPERRVWQMRDHGMWREYFVNAALALLYLAMGLVALLTRPRDPGVVAGALLLFMFGGFLMPGGGAGTAVLFRQLPFPLQVPLFVQASLLGGYLILVFCALYPRPVFRRPWVLPVLLVPSMLIIAYNVSRFCHRLFMPEQAISPGPPWEFRLQLAIEMTNIVAGLIVLALGYRRLRDPHERRGLRRVGIAALISFGAFVLYFGLLSLEPSSPILRRIFQSEVTGYVLLFLWIVFPLAFAYTVVRTRVRVADSGASTV
jgi:PDZ domain